MVPKQRKTKSRRNQRRSHHALKKKHLINCSKCKAKTLPHTVCVVCGFYKNKEVIDVMAKLTKREKKQAQKEQKQKEKQEKKRAPLSLENLSKKSYG